MTRKEDKAADNPGQKPEEKAVLIVTGPGPVQSPEKEAPEPSVLVAGHEKETVKPKNPSTKG